MRKILLPVLGFVFAAPLAVAMTQKVDFAAIGLAHAEPPGLMEGCGDVPEAIALAEELRDRALRIERYLEEVDNRETELQSAEATLRARLTELKAMKASIRNGQVTNKGALQSDIDRLVSVYDQMKPAEAAAVLTNLPADFAAEILMRVQPETGARIIAAVEPGQAAILTTHMGARSVRRNK